MSQESAHAESPGWWDPAWTSRQVLNLNTGNSGLPLPELTGDPVVLVRLASDFPFAGAAESGSDLRFLGPDHKTLLPYHIERWDGLLNEALVWVRVPEWTAGTSTTVWMYSGNPTAPPAQDPKGTYDSSTRAVFHFDGPGGTPGEDSGTAAAPGSGNRIPVATSLIAGGLRFTGNNTVVFPASSLPPWSPQEELTLTLWAKAAGPGKGEILFSRREGGNSFLLGIDEGKAFVSVNAGNAGQRLTSAEAIPPGTWQHLAVTFKSGTLTLYLNGKEAATANAPLPALTGDSLLGGDGGGGTGPAGTGLTGFLGEVDELTVAATARSAGFLRFCAINQGPSAEAAQLLQVGPPSGSGGGEGHSEISEHLNLIRDISKSLTIDGWIVIWACGILAAIGWAVAIGKLLYLNRIAGSSRIFLRQWARISTDLTALDHADEDHVRSMGGQTSQRDQKAMKESPLFHLYHLGSQEIQHRIALSGGSFQGLPERSITSIRALLDGGANREIQRLQSKLVFLTIGIAGGPYLGLLGTVIGVMITFAVIAKSGEVDINSIAPGIAGALLATVAGLAVAIPALFAYSYLSSRIKDSILSMNTFIEEFIARIAEAYPSKD